MSLPYFLFLVWTCSQEGLAVGHDPTLIRNATMWRENRQGGSETAGDETLGNWCGVAFVGRFVCNTTRSATFQGQCSYEQLGAGPI